VAHTTRAPQRAAAGARRSGAGVRGRPSRPRRGAA